MFLEGDTQAQVREAPQEAGFSPPQCRDHRLQGPGDSHRRRRALLYSEHVLGMC